MKPKMKTSEQFELFANAARKYLEVGEDDYEFKQYKVGLDHMDLASQASFAMWFFLAGLEEGMKYNERT